MEKDSAKLRISQIIKSYFRTVPIENSDYQGELASSDVNNIVDKIELGHPKVKLPREVGEELDDWKKSNFNYNLSGYIEDVDADLDGVEKTMSWIYHRDDTSEQKRTELYGILADAYRYGWEAEPEELFYVKAPESWNHRWAWKSAGSIFKGRVCWKDGLELNEARYEQFTRAELKQYHLDSDIFTLVPVEEEK